MIKTVGVVSLSAGTLGEDFVRHELELGVRRLEHYGLKVRFLPHALKGIDYLKAHPEARAADLLEAFRDLETLRHRRRRHLPAAAVPLRRRPAGKCCL